MNEHHSMDGIQIFECDLEKEAVVPDLSAYEIPISCQRCGKTVVMSAFMFDGQDVFCKACRIYLKFTL